MSLLIMSSSISKDDLSLSGHHGQNVMESAAPAGIKMMALAGLLKYKITSFDIYSNIPPDVI